MSHGPLSIFSDFEFNVVLFNQHDFTRPPGLLKPWFERAIHSENDEPALAGNGLEPVVLVSLGSLRGEVDVSRAVIVVLDPLGLATDGGEELAGLEHRTGLCVVNRDCPEVIDRRICWNVQLVGLSAIEGLFDGIDIGDGIVRPVPSRGVAMAGVTAV